MRRSRRARLAATGRTSGGVFFEDALADVYGTSLHLRKASRVQRILLPGVTAIAIGVMTWLFRAGIGAYPSTGS